MIKKVFIFLGFTLLFSCSTVKEPILTSVNNINVESNDSLLFIESNLSIYNPNWFVIKSEKLYYLLLNDTVSFAKGESKTPINIPSKDTTNIFLNLEIDSKKIIDSVFIDEKLNIRVLGYTIVPIIDTFYFDFNYPIESDPVFKSLIEHFVSEDDLDIKSIRLKKIELQNTDVEILFDLKNSSGVSYALNEVKIKVYDDNSKQFLIGNSLIDERILVRADSTLNLSCDATINNLTMLSSMFSKKTLIDRVLYLEISAEVEINKLLIPVSFGKELKFDPLNFDLKLND